MASAQAAPAFLAQIDQPVNDDEFRPVDQLKDANALRSDYEKLRIDPHTKRLVFSDGLDFDSAISLHHHFSDRTQCGFGIGTNLTNDMGLKTLHIVMKLTHANRQPVAKLSDSPGKLLCDAETFLAYLRQVFKVDS